MTNSVFAKADEVFPSGKLDHVNAPFFFTCKPDGFAMGTATTSQGICLSFYVDTILALRETIVQDPADPSRFRLQMTQGDLQPAKENQVCLMLNPALAQLLHHQLGDYLKRFENNEPA